MFIYLLIFLISVAFLTFYERKILGCFHFRLGPLRLGLYGIFQPFSDALKLFTKIFLRISGVKNVFYFLGPFYGFILFLFIVILYSLVGRLFLLKFS